MSKLITVVNLTLLLITANFFENVVGGPVTYAACQAICAAGVVACYSAAGFTFGTVVASVATPVVIVACNTAFGACSAKCALLLLVPTP